MFYEQLCLETLTLTLEAGQYLVDTFNVEYGWL